MKDIITEIEEEEIKVEDIKYSISFEILVFIFVFKLSNFVFISIKLLFDSSISFAKL